MTPRIKAWVNELDLMDDYKLDVLTALGSAAYLSTDLLKEEAPEVLVELPEVKKMKPGIQLVLKKAFRSLKASLSAFSCFHFSQQTAQQQFSLIGLFFAYLQ